MKLGWRDDLEDRAYLHRGSGLMRTLPRTFSAPKVIDHRSWRASHIERQQRNDCVGHGGSSGCEVLNFIDTKGNELRLSPEFNYHTSQRKCGITTDDGATISGCIEALKDWGICTEKTMPYRSSYDRNIPDEAFAEAKSHRILSHEPLSSYDDVYRWIATGTGVVIIGVKIQESLFECGAVLESMTGDIAGGHCMLLHGLSDRKARDSRQYPILENSWGTSWGDKGFTEVSPKLMDWWCQDSYSEVVGISDLEQYDDGGGDRWSWLENGVFV
jgi:hypothetical protein